MPQPNNRDKDVRVMPYVAGGNHPVNPQNVTYTVTVDATDRTLDASAVNDAAKLSDVLATLIQDLKNSGIIK